MTDKEDSQIDEVYQDADKRILDQTCTTDDNLHTTLEDPMVAISPEWDNDKEVDKLVSMEQAFSESIIASWICIEKLHDLELNKKETAIVVSSSLIKSLHDLFEAAGVTKDDAGVIHRKLQSIQKEAFSLFLSKRDFDRLLT